MVNTWLKESLKTKRAHPHPHPFPGMLFPGVSGVWLKDESLKRWPIAFDPAPTCQWLPASQAAAASTSGHLTHLEVALDALRARERRPSRYCFTAIRQPQN